MAEQPDTSRAPWTDAEVENLRRRQAARWLHPYTGPGHVNLIPSTEGWRLPDGTLYQEWAWRSDVEGDIGTDPLESLLGQLRRAPSPPPAAPQPGPLAKPHEAASTLTKGTHRTAVGHCAGPVPGEEGEDA